MNEVLHSDRTIVLNNGKIVKDDKTLEVMNDRSALDQSNLEMPSDLYLYHELKKNNYSNEEVLKVLWELASRK
jgi:energy-coupling factor transporter ATP-binding protein EcfA2